MKSFYGRVKKAIKNPKHLLLYLLGKPPVSRAFPEKVYLKLKYRLIMGKKLDLKNPKSFNEKLQWLKLYNRKDEYTVMADKYAVRKYIAEKIGEEYLVPLLGVWDRADDIDFDKLPDKFVLKCNHNSGLGMCICKDKSKLDTEKVRKELNKGLNQDYYLPNLEWPYKNVSRKIVGEKYMADRNGKFTDYKFMCFNGYVPCVMVCVDRDIGDTKFYFYDKEWNLLRYNEKSLKKYSNLTLPKPSCIDKMFEIAECLSAGLPFARIDLYECDGKIYFGEITFFPDGGFDANITTEAEQRFGDLIDLYSVKNQKREKRER